MGPASLVNTTLLTSRALSSILATPGSFSYKNCSHCCPSLCFVSSCWISSTACFWPSSRDTAPDRELVSLFRNHTSGLHLHHLQSMSETVSFSVCPYLAFCRWGNISVAVACRSFLSFWPGCSMLILLYSTATVACFMSPSSTASSRLVGLQHWTDFEILTASFLFSTIPPFPASSLADSSFGRQS